MSMLAPAQRSAMEPAARRDRSEKSLSSKLRFRPQNFVAVLKVLDIIVDVMFFHRPFGVMTRSMGA